MSVLRYPGGKSRAAKFIVPLLPGDRDLFSPCFGGGHAEFAWSELHPGRRMLGCELFEPVATFWQQARLNPGAVADIAARYHPIDQAGFAELQQRVRAGIDDPVELAALTYVLNRSSFSGATLRGGSSQEARAKRWTQSAIDRLRAFKAPNAEVRHTDGLDALETLLAHHSPDAWDIYVDPPYEAVEGLYGSGSAHHEDFDHERLAALLRWADALG